MRSTLVSALIIFLFGAVVLNVYKLLTERGHLDVLNSSIHRGNGHAIVLNGTWSVSLAEGRTHSEYGFVQIPKCTSASFSLDAMHHIPQGSYLKSYPEFDLCASGPPKNAVVFLRDPRHHVYSQFLECKYGDWGKIVTSKSKMTFLRDNMEKVSGGFKEWVTHFRNGEKDDYNCYNPTNMMTRYLACIRVSQDDKRSTHHSATTDYRDLEVAKGKLLEAAFVGISDHYNQSVCAFEYVTSGTTKCECVAGKLITHSETTLEDHNVPPHSLREMSDDILRLIDSLTVLDAQLYNHAYKSFWSFVDVASNATGVDLRCGGAHAGNNLRELSFEPFYGPDKPMPSH